MVQNTRQILSSLLEKTSNWDKDERYMATSDLCNELGKDIVIDPELERRICSAVLKQLDDSSNDVQSIAVKCLGILLKKVQEAQIGEISDKLCSLILEGKPELRDVYSIGLKTLISDVPEPMGGSVVRRLTDRLLGGVQQEIVVEIKLECLDNLSDLMRRFGHDVEHEHGRIVEILLNQLIHEKPVVRKRTAACLGSIAVVILDPLLNKLILNLLSQIKTFKRPEIVRTLIQTIGTISRTVGYRLGRHLDSIVPLFLHFCGDVDMEDMHSEAASELRENCFQGFESFVLRCPREVTQHLDSILSVALKFTCYDPNYSYNNNMENESDEEADEDFLDDDFGDLSDEDDSSWKVRRSAVRVVRAVIVTRPELLESLCGFCCDVLVSRFKEREENVRVDVVGCLANLLDSVSAAESRQLHARIVADPSKISAISEGDMFPATVLIRTKLHLIVQAAQKQLKIEKGGSRNPKTVMAMWQMLRSLCRALRGGLSGTDLGPLMDSVLCSLKDKHQGLKLEALVFLRLVLESHSSAVMSPYISKLVPAVTLCVKDEGYKVIAEALRVTSNLVECMCPLDSEQEVKLDWKPYVPSLYEAILPRLSAHDIDQEIKECAIGAMGIVLARMGTELKPQLPIVLNLLMDRLRNEITRVATLRAIALISNSSSQINLSPILNEATQELALLLKQQSRPIKQASLEALLALLNGYAAQINPPLLTQVLLESSSLISDSDLQLAHFSLQIASVTLSRSESFPSAIQMYVVPNIFSLVVSPLLQGLALSSLLDLFKVLTKVGAPGLTFQDLIASLQHLAVGSSTLPGTPVARQVVTNLALCVAAVCASTEEAQWSQILNSLLKDARGSDNGRRHLALLSLAELAMLVDLKRLPDLHDLLLSTFDDNSSSEEVKTAAAYALGRLAVGEQTTYLPVVLEALETTRHQYLLLTSLKEVILCHAHSRSPIEFSKALHQVLPHLFGHCQSPEEGVRNMVAECLGALATMYPDELIPALLEALQNSSKDEPNDALMRWTVATALKHCMAGGSSCETLAPHLGTFMLLLKDADLDVRRAALLLANAAVHHQPHIVKDMLADVIMPVLFETIELKMERVVDLGPFKHKVDDAEPLRKAALACIDTVLDAVPEKLNEAELLPHLAKGLADLKPDVQTLCHQILAKLCILRPGAVLNSMDILIPPLDKAANRQVKEGQVGTEVDRANELARSALRCVAAMSRMTDIEASRSFLEFRERLLKNEKISGRFEAVLAER